MIILLDMDGVVADFEAGFLARWREKFPQRSFIPLSERKGFYPENQYPEEDRADVRAIQREPGYYLNLPPISGAIEAVQAMFQLGHTVRFCSAPLADYENCVAEKYRWIEKHFGREAIKKIILAKDKTFIRGDVLIDDKPGVTGELTPYWRQFLFSAPYNLDFNGARRITWDNWRDVLAI